MSFRERSDTYSSLCETEDDFVASERDHYPNELLEHDTIDLENVLLKESAREEVTPSPIDVQKPIALSSDTYKHLQKNMTEEILSRLESAMVAETESEQDEIMDDCLLILSNYIDLRILSRLDLSPLTANSLYCEIVSEYICTELENKNDVLLKRLIEIANSMSSHMYFDPIFCELTMPFVSSYLHTTLTHPNEIDVSEPMQTFFLPCLVSVFKGSNRLFMFDLNNNQSKFEHLYTAIKETVLQCSKEYTELCSLDLTNADSQWRENVLNHRVVVRVFLSDLLTILGKYFVYYELETELGGIIEGVNNSCRLLDLQRYHRPSSILLLYTILVLSQIRSEETLITYLKKLHQFKDITLNFDLSVRMQSVLQRLSTEGGPLFPTEEVREAANETLDVLYPSGRWPRLFIHFLFGFLHPYYRHLQMMRVMKKTWSMTWDGVMGYFGTVLAMVMMIMTAVANFYVECARMAKEKMKERREEREREKEREKED